MEWELTFRYPLPCTHQNTGIYRLCTGLKLIARIRSYDSKIAGLLERHGYNESSLLGWVEISRIYAYIRDSTYPLDFSWLNKIECLNLLDNRAHELDLSTP